MASETELSPPPGMPDVSGAAAAGVGGSGVTLAAGVATGVEANGFSPRLLETAGAAALALADGIRLPESAAAPSSEDLVRLTVTGRMIFQPVLVLITSKERFSAWPPLKVISASTITPSPRTVAFR